MASKKKLTAVHDLRGIGRVRRLLVVFGDQLDARTTVMRGLDKSRDAVLMMEVGDEATHVPSHKQRTALFLSAMRHFALQLRSRGYRVHYVPLDDPDNTHSFDGEFRRAMRDLAPEPVVCTTPGEWRVVHMVSAWRLPNGKPVEMVNDEHFLITTEAFAEWAASRKRLVLEHFYRRQRRDLGVLVDASGGPSGGTWNLDAENREPLRGEPWVRRPYRARPDAVTREVLQLVAERFADGPGSLDSFGWPITRAEARRALNDFVAYRLPRFGTYQDAMWTEQPFLYHSLLSPALNLKLLDPLECVEAAIAACDSGHAPLNAVEGFVRQIIGWREFIRGVYWYAGSDYGDQNGLDQHGRLPEFYWTGDTRMNCLRRCVGQVLETGYGHHIQRLMVTGNFALIAGVHPRRICDWYRAMYVDAVDWVTLPNTLGMVMHADGGLVGTKPYAASGRYIQRMSNYCQGCPFDPESRTGEEACPFNTFYWDFLLRTRASWNDNPRMALSLRNAERLDAAERKTIRAEASTRREEFGIGAPDDA